MIDIKEEKKSVAAAPEALHTPAPPQKTPAQEKIPARISKGEKWHKWIFYDLLNYWVNLGSSIVMADYFTHHGSSGRKYLDWAAGKISKTLAATKTLSLKTAHHHTRVGLETLVLLSGGWALLPILKLGEDHKRPIVHWLNKHVFKEKQLAADGHEMTPDEIHIEEEQPKQSWGNTIKRRVLATAAVVGSGMVLDHVAADRSVKTKKTYDLDPFSANGKITHDSYLGGKERTTNFVLGGFNKGLGWLAGSKTPIKADPNALPQRYMALGILDSVFTKITAVIMYITRPRKDEPAPHSQAGPLPAVPATLVPKDAALPAQFPSLLEEKYKHKKPVMRPSENYADMVKSGEMNEYSRTP